MRSNAKATPAIQFKHSVSIDSAASMIGVSNATIRNWVKAGHLTPAHLSPLCFWQEDVIKLKAAIGSGKVARLRTRANKSNADNTLIPKEYLGHQVLIETVQGIVDAFRSASLDLNATMFVVALRMLELRGEVMLSPSASLHEWSALHAWRRNAIKTEMLQWQATLSEPLEATGYKTIYFTITQVDADDFMGLVYQSLNRVGDKSNQGSYYTPSNIINDALCQQSFSGGSFLDPCCGTGNYLLHAINALHVSPENLWGFDSDPLAVRIARINVYLAFPAYASTLNIECLNALTELATGDVFCPSNHMLSTIDFIATNPPWGAYKNSSILFHQSCGINSTEAFALFLAKSLTILREGGVLSFVLPESFLNIRTHREIRSLILDNTKIVRLVKLGRQFTGVFTKVIRLDLIKEKPTPEWSVAIVDDGNFCYVEQSRFNRNEYQSIDIDVTSSEGHIIDKLYAIEHATLRGNADWALGIVTGNNAKYVHSDKAIGMEAVIRGSDIAKFKLKNPQSFIYFEPSAFQQVAHESLYRADEKLVYKFISKSLAFAYDDQQRLTLNSANILIPRLENYGIKVVLAYLNSTVFQYVFMKKYATHKVLRGDLEKLPFPVLPTHACQTIATLVDEIHAGKDKFAELDNLIFSSFQLSDEDIQQIKKAVIGK